METCISSATPKLIVKLVSKASSVRTETGQLPLPENKIPKAGGLVSTMKPPPPKVEERSIPKLKPKLEVPPRPEQNQDDCSNAGDSRAQDGHSPNKKYLSLIHI